MKLIYHAIREVDAGVTVAIRAVRKFRTESHTDWEKENVEKQLQELMRVGESIRERLLLPSNQMLMPAHYIFFQENMRLFKKIKGELLETIKKCNKTAEDSTMGKEQTTCDGYYPNFSEPHPCGFSRNSFSSDSQGVWDWRRARCHNENLNCGWCSDFMNRGGLMSVDFVLDKWVIASADGHYPYNNYKILEKMEEERQLKLKSSMEKSCMYKTFEELLYPNDGRPHPCGSRFLLPTSVSVRNYLRTRCNRDDCKWCTDFLGKGGKMLRDPNIGFHYVIAGSYAEDYLNNYKVLQDMEKEHMERKKAHNKSLGDKLSLGNRLQNIHTFNWSPTPMADKNEIAIDKNDPPIPYVEIELEDKKLKITPILVSVAGGALVMTGITMLGGVIAGILTGGVALSFVGFAWNTFNYKRRHNK